MSAMKKALLLFAASLLALGGCNANQNEDSSSSGGSLSLTSTAWDQNTREMMMRDFGMVLPEAKHDSFSIEEGVDEYGDPTLWVYCFFNGHTSTVQSSGEEGGDEVIQAAITDYIDTLSLSNWAVNYNDSYSAYVCDYETGSKGVEMWVLEGAVNGKEALGIYAYPYVVAHDDVWPSDLIQKVVGTDVPAYVLQKGESLQSWEQEGDSSSGNKPYVGIAVTDVADPEGIGARYADICQKAGYTVLTAEDEDSGYDDFLAFKDKASAPCIYSYYDIDYTAFYLFVLPVSASAFMGN